MLKLFKRKKTKVIISIAYRKDYTFSPLTFIDNIEKLCAENDCTKSLIMFDNKKMKLSFSISCSNIENLNKCVTEINLLQVLLDTNFLIKFKFK